MVGEGALVQAAMGLMQILLIGFTMFAFLIEGIKELIKSFGGKG